MSSTTSKSSVTARVTALETGIREVKADLSGIKGSIDRLTAFLVPTPEVTTTKAAKGKKGKATAKPAKAATTSGPTFKENQIALRALKAEGKAPALMTVVQAVAANLLPPVAQTGTATAKAGKAKGKKTPEVAAKQEAYSAFRNLRDALKAHKESGAIPRQYNGTFVTVNSAIADGLLNEDGTVGEKAAKALKATAEATPVKASTKKAKGARVVATVTDAQRAASEAPRRADGTITPKREWALREELALTGKYDRNQIDKRVRKAMKVLDNA